MGTGAVRASTESSMPDEMESAQNPTEPSPEDQTQKPDEASGESSAGAEPDADALAADALASAQAAIDALNAESDQSAGAEKAPTSGAVADAGDASPQLSPLSVPDFAKGDFDSVPKGMDMLSDVNVDVTIELGRTRMLVEDVLRLADGAVVELDKLAGDPVDIYVNKRLVARGEVLVLNDNFCIRVNDILDADLVEQNRG